MSDGHLQNLITGGGKHPWIDGAPPRTFAAWLTSATAENLLPDASFLVPRLTLGGLAILRDRFMRPARLRILLPVGPVLRDAAEAPRYRLLATTPAELILDNQLTQGVDARRLHRWLASDAIEVRTVACDTALPWMAAVDGVLLVGNAELTRECLAPAYAMPQAGLFAPDASSGAALAAVYERLWEQGQDVKGELRKTLATLYAPNAPRFIYFLSLWHLFHDRLDEWRGAIDNDRSLEETPIWKALYAFQRHGAIAALRKLKKDGGCILADSVGLGKTYTALAVIKAYERMSQRVLVFCPKKLRTNWARFLQDDDYNPLPTLNGRSDFFYALLNHTDLSLDQVDPGRGMRVPREEFFRKDFGLIVIDESHNFRNRGGKRYQFLLDYLKAHPKTKLLMLSATPVSNRLADLTHQLGLVYRGDEPPSGPFLREVVAVVQAAQHIATRWSREHADDPEALSAATLANVLPSTYFRLLERYTIARSRSGISKFYDDAETEIGVFPKCKSLSCYPEIDTQSARVDVTTLSDRLNDLTLVAYNPTHCLRAGIRWHEEEEGKQLLDKNRQKSLTALMRINALKRLESSVDSFRRTVRDAVLARTQAQIEALAKGTVRLPWVTAKALLGEVEAKRQAKAAALGIDPDTLDEDDEALAEGLSREVVLPAKQYFDVAALKRYLKQDLGVLKGILDDVESVGPARDAKLAELEHVLQEKVDHPLNPGNEKTLIFSAFADTVEYVAKALAERHPERHIACVSGSKGIVWHGGRAKAEEMGRILRRFAPYAQCPKDPETGEPRREKEPEIDWVVATDCLSEGQNLQDCDLVVHYDIHWNPLRLAQRIGRIDRIGSRNKFIRNVLFWPCKDLNQYIGLERMVRTKIAFGAIVAPDGAALGNEVKQDLDYRERQLQAIQHSHFDMDAFFTGNQGEFDDYLAELDAWLRADKAREKRCAEAPLGLCAVTPAALTETFAKSGLPVPTRGGVLFLLRRAGLSEEEIKVNPFRDCFLLAADKDGKPLGALQPLSPEETLALFRALCRDRAKADTVLATRLGDLDPKAFTPALEGALRQLGVTRETNRAKLLLGDEPFDFHTGLTDDRAALTLLTFALILPEETITEVGE